MKPYESLKETTEILKNQALMKKILSSAKDIKKGQVVRFEDIRKDV